MPKIHKPRAGSLQFWPRKRAAKLLPSVNWSVLEKKYIRHKGLLGFICYKAGMARVLARDLTPDSMTKNKQVIIPITILECPPMKLLSVRFYKNKQVFTEVLAENLDKELKRKIKLPKTPKKITEIAQIIEEIKTKGIDNVRILVYSIAKLTGIKKTPDIAEIGLGGSLEDKLNFIKEHLTKEFNINECFAIGQLVDVRGVTKGHGFTGPVKRFGIGLKSHKAEKGRRRPGSLGPWTPSRVTFRVAMAGQYGFFSRIHYNSKLLAMGTNKFEFPHYGKIRTNYVALKGSVQGPAKRQVLITMPLRETKSAAKENFEVVEFLK